MQDPKDKFTVDILGKKRRGRPPTGRARTPAEHKAAQRERDRNAAPSSMTVSGIMEALARAVREKDLSRFDALTQELRTRM
ncbi:hypothetical protein LJR129_004966 [Acidovorax sp. LjRoot129]|uniref:hypothetical protein n=1 Tax=unclassified Acidovorax TaxID=2684926 RepID=UPI003ECFFC12